MPSESRRQEDWDPIRGRLTDIERAWWARLRALARDSYLAAGLTLGLVDGPRLVPHGSSDPGSSPSASSSASSSRDAASVPTYPALKAGLYIGDYSHGMYGDFGNETLLLERRRIALASPAPLLELFRRDPQKESLLRELQESGAETCVILTGRKITGDCHVPMGATTFIALLEPMLESFLPPPTVVNTKAGQERVCQGWSGFGTLAMPGFRNPSWDQGWLVQMEDDQDGHRFAFVWKSMQFRPANTLTQVVAQNTAYFLGEENSIRLFGAPPEAATGTVLVDLY